MIIRWLKISAAIFLTLILSVSLTKLIVCIWENFQLADSIGEPDRIDVDAWLQQNRLDQYKNEFRKRGNVYAQEYSLQFFLNSCRVLCSVENTFCVQINHWCEYFRAGLKLTTCLNSAFFSVWINWKCPTTFIRFDYSATRFFHVVVTATTLATLHVTLLRCSFHV